MLSKSFTASALLLALTSSVTAQCIITPALGITGTPKASDVQHPSDSGPCGSISIPQYINSSTPVQAEASGQFKVTIQGFDNASRSISKVTCDPSGTGDGFVGAQIVTNGADKPTGPGTQEVTAKLPDNAKCIGGQNKDRCVVSFVTGGGSGNCVVVTQSGNGVKRSAPKEKPKPAPAKVEPTAPPKSHKPKTDKRKGGKRSASKEKPKPAPAKVEPTTPPKSHKSKTDKKKGGKRMMMESW